MPRHSDSWAACRPLALAVWFAVLVVSSLRVPAATRAIDLDGQTGNGAESKCDLNVLASFPVNIENVVTNKTDGSAFDFSWPSAGPGGFTSSVAPGTTGGVGAKWTWSTVQTVYSFTGSSCATDICFLGTSSPLPLVSTCSRGCLDDGVAVRANKGTSAGEVALTWSGGTAAYTVYRSASPVALADPVNALLSTDLLQYNDAGSVAGIVYYLVRGTNCITPKSCTTNADCEPRSEGTCATRGPFSVPGRTMTPSNVTVSSASLSSSLITFFSPPTEVFRVTSTAQPGGILETLTNGSTDPVTVVTEAYPPGCCPTNPAAPHLLRCGDDCVDYLSDPQNCGACGNVCGEGNCCSNGNCASLCGVGRTWCDGLCADLTGDNDNCGACGNPCGEGTCCSGGLCASVCAEGESWCDGRCADVHNDSGNCGSCGHVCAEGSCCYGGTCASFCTEGETWCDGQCADLQNDSLNCGGCGTLCAQGTCCAAGTCASECEAGRTYCAGTCYDLMNDEEYCGACGVVCGENQFCLFGVCTNYSDDPDGSHRHPPYDSPLAECPNPHPSLPSPGGCHNPDPSPGPVDGVCPNSSPSWPVEGVCPSPGPPAPEVPEAPVCQVDPAITTVAPGASTTICQPGGLLYKEVASAVSVCGDGVPGPDGQCQDGISNVSTGTFMRLVPDTDQTVGDAYITPYAVHVTQDSSADGMIEPGENVSLVIEVLNVGPVNISNASATLVVPPVDLTDDGVSNPVEITVGCGASWYGTIQGTEPSTNCEPLVLHPASNATAFQITLPDFHPGDTSRPFTLRFSGTVAGSPFSMDVPIIVGIADRCDYAAATRDYDGLIGLRSPMAKLVPVGDPVPFPTRARTRGQTIPLKLRQYCGEVNLQGGEVDAPEIAGLAKAGFGPIDIAALALNDDTNSNDPFFRWVDGCDSFDGDCDSASETDANRQWIYNMRTSALARGTYTLTIRIAGRKNYVTGFVLR